MFYKFFFSLLLLTAMLTSQEVHYLQKQDIQKIMNEILEKHVEKNQMTSAILKEGFKYYIEQFDPRKEYLLESEVTPFLNPTENQLEKYLASYKKNDYSSFVQLNDLIQKSIVRARKLRQLIESDPQALFRRVIALETAPVNFAEDKAELKKRQQQNIMAFIGIERERYGQDVVSRKQEHVLSLYERDIRDFENNYLYVDDQGKPVTPQEEEHEFTLHVLKALARSLDAHTRVFNPTEAEDMRARLLKGYVGTGIIFEEGIDTIRVAKIIADSPASTDRRLRIGDILTKIDHQPVADQSFQKVMQLLQGPEGEAIDLTFTRLDTGTSYNVHLTRENVILDEDRVDVNSVPFQDGIIGVLKLDSFYHNGTGISSVRDIKEGITKLRKTTKLKGLILDLRNNSGGYLSEAVKVAGLFITNGVIVISKYNDGQETIYRDLEGKTYYEGPLVVLISRLTASAAEIVAQALQDYGVAVIVGDDRSFGKGSIQSQNVTTDQASSYFKVTVGKYYTVSGKTPQLEGVQADIVVPSELITEKIGEKYTEESLQNDTIAPSYKDSLADISPEARSWFLRYYLPTIQPRKTSWQKMMSELKSLSINRIKQIPGFNLQHYVSSSDQLAEAVNIVKDMIELRSKLSDRQIGVYD